MVGKQIIEADSAYMKKLRKPMVEKRRRDRMNVGIEQLRTLLAATHCEMTLAKLDKAEVLEQAVRHLTMLQQRQKTTPASRVGIATSYRAGFRDCTKETVRYLEASGLTPRRSIIQLDGHLRHACDARLKQTATSSISKTATSSLSVDSTRQPYHQFSSTPITSSTSQRFLPVPTIAFQRDSVSPVGLLDDSVSCKDVVYPLNLSRQFSNASPVTSIGESDGERCPSPADSGISCGASSSSESVSLATTSIESTTDVMKVTSSDTASDFIKEEAPWRPW